MPSHRSNVSHIRRTICTEENVYLVQQLQDCWHTSWHLREIPRVSLLLLPWFCKTQNSGLRSKEEKPRDPINQPSRCNAQEGLLSVVQTGDSDLLGGRAHRTANWASFICSMLHTGYKVIGYMFAKQSYWYKLRGLLFKLKAILLVQTARTFVQT